MLTPLPLTCGVVIDGAVISKLNICYEILLILLDLVTGSLSLSLFLSLTAVVWSLLHSHSHPAWGTYTDTHSTECCLEFST